MARVIFRKAGNVLKQAETLQLNCLRTFAVESSSILQLNSAPTSPLEQLQSQAGSASPRSTLGVLAYFGGFAALAYAQLSPHPAHAEPSEKPAIGADSDELAVYRRVRQKRGLPKEIILYQYEVCPFCNKVRAFLDYHNVPYRVVEVNPLTKKQIKWSEYKKVPVVMLDDEVINDSSTILSRMAVEFEKELPPQKKGWFQKGKEVATGVSVETEDEEMKWRQWVDTVFVRLITVNIYRTAKESWQTFDYIASHANFNFAERQAARIAGSTLMYGISGRLIKKYGIKGDLRTALYDAAEDWVQALGDQEFKGGDEPDLADLSVFGVIRSVTGTDTFQDLMHNTKISSWYERMMAVVGESSRIPT